MAKKSSKAPAPAAAPGQEPPPEGTYGRLVWEAFSQERFSDPQAALRYYDTYAGTVVLNARKIPGREESGVVLWQLLGKSPNYADSVLLSMADHSQARRSRPG